MAVEGDNDRPWVEGGGCCDRRWWQWRCGSGAYSRTLGSLSFGSPSKCSKWGKKARFELLKTVRRNIPLDIPSEPRFWWNIWRNIPLEAFFKKNFPSPSWELTVNFDPWSDGISVALLTDRQISVGISDGIMVHRKFRRLCSLCSSFHCDVRRPVRQPLFCRHFPSEYWKFLVVN